MNSASLIISAATPAPPGRSWPLFAGLGPLGALPTASRLVRTFCALILASWGLGGFTDDCELIASEFAANVIRAAAGPDGHPRYDGHGRLPVLWVRLLSNRTQVRVEVWDNLAPERGVPSPRVAATYDESGRGLELVGQLSHDWGWERLPGQDAKCVWALLNGES